LGRLPLLLPHAAGAESQWVDKGLERAASPSAAATHTGKPLAAHALSVPRRLRDACVQQMPGAPVRRACLWMTRITGTEGAAMNRRARFPAAQRVGVLRIASAVDAARSRRGVRGPVNQRRSRTSAEYLVRRDLGLA